MRPIGFLAFFAAAALEAGALALVVRNPSQSVDGLATPIFLHALACSVFALGATLSTRRNAGHASRDGALGLFAFFVLLALTMPVIGISIGIVVSRLLTFPVRADSFAKRFLIGNPLLDRASHRGVPPVPPAEFTPLAIALRRLGPEQLPRLILGLKQMLPEPGARALLRSFQRDESAQIQFYAQSVLGDETGRLEDHLAGLGTRAALNPDDSETRLAIAEILVHLASLAGIATADRQTQARLALDHLGSLPEIPATLLLGTRVNLLLGQVTPARASLERFSSLGGAPHLVDDLRRELLFLEGDWKALANDTAPAVSIPHRAAMQFWRSASV